MPCQKAVQPVGDARQCENQRRRNIDVGLRDVGLGEVEEGGEDGDEQNPQPCEQDGNIPRHNVCSMRVGWAI